MGSVHRVVYLIDKLARLTAFKESCTQKGMPTPLLLASQIKDTEEQLQQAQAQAQDSN